MTSPTPYLYMPGTARAALAHSGEVFGCSVQLHTLAEFGRADGPPEAIAHGRLHDRPVSLFAADATGDQEPFHGEGMMLSLLGSDDSAILRSWIAALADGGHVVADLQERPWGPTNGQVVDRYGLHWLTGFEPENPQ